MTNTPTGPAAKRQVSVRQIADLLAWARRLAEQPFDVDQRERAAFHKAKIDLLSRITNDIIEPDQTDERTTGHAMDGGGV